MKDPIDDFLSVFFEFILLNTLSEVYEERKKQNFQGYMRFSNLLIDKFAIHSSSFFFLSKGIVEVNKNNEKIIKRGYDLFTVNSTFRVMMECYATFNHIFVEPKSEDEIEFRFLLWKIDSLYDKQRFDINEADFKEVKEILEKDKMILSETIDELLCCKLYAQLDQNQIDKIYKPEKRKSIWRFELNNGIVTPLKISDLIKHTCKTRAFINLYRYTSLHTHSNYLSLEYFEQTRGKIITKEYTDPLMKLAIYLTIMMIKDICKIDSNVDKFFNGLPDEIQFYMNGIYNSIMNNSSSS